MNTFSIEPEKINEILKQDYEYLKTIYAYDQIFGVFIYGKACYGFAETIEDIEVKMYYLPTLKEMCTDLILKDENIKYNNHNINVKDIRLIFNNVLSQEGTTMECFFSDYYIITPKFKKVYMDVVLKSREDIFKHNPKARTACSMNKAYEALDLYKQTNNPEYLWDACRRRVGTSLYLEGASVKECITLNKDYLITYLWNIKKGISLPNMQEVIEDLERMKAQVPLLPEHPELEEKIKQIIVNIIETSLTKTISIQEFLNMLTEPEKQALKYVMKYVYNGEGSFSVSKLVEESKLSRPVFKSLQDKLKNMEIAEITNMGVKGTGIKIIDGVFLNIDKYIK